MKFIYRDEKRKFDRAWEKTAKYYAEQGMSQEAIDAMHKFDLEAFNAERVWAMHTQEISVPDNVQEDMYMAESPLLRKFLGNLTTQYDTHGEHSRFWWMEEISDQRISRVLCKLSSLDKTILTMYWIEGYTQEEIAVILHMDRGAVSMKIHRIFSRIAKNQNSKKNVAKQVFSLPTK